MAVAEMIAKVNSGRTPPSSVIEHIVAGASDRAGQWARWRAEIESVFVPGSRAEFTPPTTFLMLLKLIVLAGSSR